MKRITTLILIPATAFAFAACRGVATKGKLATFTDSASYAIGMNMAGTLQRTGADVDIPSLVQGLSDVLGKKDLRMTEADASAVLREFSNRMQEAEVSNRQQLGEKNLREGEAYRTQNAKRSEVVTTASGLQYEVLTKGQGPKPKATDRVTVNYRGTLIDGEEFDSSYRSGQPVTFALNRVIPGWTEAVQLMSVGSKYRIVLPPTLGYGAQGSPPVIAPNATLIFEVELLGIN